LFLDHCLPAVETVEFLGGQSPDAAVQLRYKCRRWVRGGRGCTFPLQCPAYQQRSVASPQPGAVSWQWGSLEKAFTPIPCLPMSPLQKDVGFLTNTRICFAYVKRESGNQEIKNRLTNVPILEIAFILRD